MSRDDFAARFAPRDFPKWDTHFGITSTSVLIDMARDLGFCGHADTRTSLDFVRDVADGGSAGILILTDQVRNDDNQLSPHYHCRLLLQYTPQQDIWRLMTPAIDGMDYIVEVPSTELAERLAHFLILYFPRDYQTPTGNA